VLRSTVVVVDGTTVEERVSVVVTVVVGSTSRSTLMQPDSPIKRATASK
jgi:hypothetical protein